MGIVRIRFVQNWIKDNILALLEFMILINIFDIIIDFILIFDFLHNYVSKIDTFDFTVLNTMTIDVLNVGKYFFANPF